MAGGVQISRASQASASSRDMLATLPVCRPRGQGILVETFVCFFALDVFFDRFAHEPLRWPLARFGQPVKAFFCGGVEI